MNLGNFLYRNGRNAVVETRGRPRKTEDTRLTKKQCDFVNLVCVKEGETTLREIAAEAGYAAKSSHTRAYELLNPRLNPHVVKAVRERRQELAEKYSVDYGRHVRDLQRIRDAAIENGAYSAAVHAEYRRGQAADLYVSRSEIRHGSIDSMSKADVEKAILDIKRQLGEEPRIIEGEVIEPEAGKPVLESVKVGTPESS